MATEPTITTLLVDLGGIFMYPQLDHKLTTPVSTVPLRRLMSSSTWMEYEVGKLTEDECFGQLVDRYGFQVDELAEIIHHYRKTILYDRDMVSIFRTIKEASQTQIILVSNISKPDYEALRERWDDTFWSIFDHVFTSSMIGARKPSLRFYRHVLRTIHLAPREVFIIDDQPENVLAAMSMGMQGTCCTLDLSRTLKNAVGNSVERGLAFLQQNAKNFHSTTQDGTIIEEVYAQMLILEVMQDSSLVDVQPPPHLWNFFNGKPQYTSDTYPEDLDTTSLGLATMPYDSDLVHSILNEMLDYVDEDGLVLAYFDKFRPRVDAVIALNVLTTFYKYGRGYELPQTLEWISCILLSRAYINGTRYYPNAEWFLYYLTRLLRLSNDQNLLEKLEVPLRARIVERIGAEGDAFCLAMRVLACNFLGVENHRDKERLKSLQWEDGGWEPSCMYLFPGASKKVGNRGATTAFAVKALQGWPPAVVTSKKRIRLS